MIRGRFCYRSGVFDLSRHPRLDACREVAGALLFQAPPGEGWPVWGGRAVLLGVLLVWGGVILVGGLDPEGAGRGFFRGVNLPFHEAGHLLFRPMGRFMASLGGSLGQVMMPLLATSVLLLKTRDPVGASVALWWTGESLVDLAPYIADARAGVMPLLGGNTGQSAPYGFHDWNYLLGETGLLAQDQGIAWGAHGLGALTMMAAIAWGAHVLWHNRPGQRL